MHAGGTARGLAGSSGGGLPGWKERNGSCFLMVRDLLVASASCADATAGVVRVGSVDENVESEGIVGSAEEEEQVEEEARDTRCFSSSLVQYKQRDNALFQLAMLSPTVCGSEAGENTRPIFQ